MKKCILTYKSIVYNGGQAMSWPVFMEAVRMLSDVRTANKMQARIEGVARFEMINLDSTGDIHPYISLTGTNEDSNIEKTRKKVIRRIKYLNSKV